VQKDQIYELGAPTPLTAGKDAGGEGPGSRRKGARAVGGSRENKLMGVYQVETKPPMQTMQTHTWDGRFESDGSRESLEHFAKNRPPVPL
jgi:hypothetical protein